MYPKQFLLLLALLSLSLNTCCTAQGWEKLVLDFTDEYEQLDISPLRIAYMDNLRAIRGSESRRAQAELFADLRAGLRAFDRNLLTPGQQVEYDLLTYYLALNEARLQLEEDWWPTRPKSLPETGLASVPGGKQWYAYYLQRWLDISVHPDSLFVFGLQESERVAAEMAAIRQSSGKDSLRFDAYLKSERFLVESAEEVEAAIADYASFVEPQFTSHFPRFDEIPPVYVRQGSDGRLAQTPAFYRNSTFFYNLFDDPFNLRQVAFLYLHEANPGHHYESHHRQLLGGSPLLRLFNNPGYGEGWAAYIEDFALNVGYYRDVYDEYGKWEWDMIRSVRVVLDVGLNYYGWSDEKALAFWQIYLPGQDHIAAREIARMKRWPAQVISYKYGARLLDQWKNRWLEENRGSLLEFHEAVLAYGQVPFSILEPIIFNSDKS